MSRYGMVLPSEPEILGVEAVLTAYATLRGYMAIGGRPDMSRSARIILKDLVAVRAYFLPVFQIRTVSDPSIT